MSTSCRQQALIEAPIESVWKLIGDPKNYVDWWPRMVEVRGERLDVGEELVAVTRRPMAGDNEMLLQVDAKQEPRELKIHCTISGVYFHWALAPAQGSTFLEAEFGIRPMSPSYRLFDLTMARRYFRSWLNASVESLSEAAEAASG
jgi:hypothetical protein